MSSEKKVKHKFKRSRRWVYLVVAHCVHCGLERIGTKGNYQYKGKEPIDIKFCNAESKGI